MMEQYQHRRDDDVVSSMKGGGSGEAETWGTWEELLLACAVQRHGLKDWDSVAMEVQGKTSLLTTAYNCKRKYHDLQRRFHDDQADQVLHHLKHLRLAQLRQDLHRYDVSILSLQLKVKRLEEEDSLKKKKKDDDPKPDLEEEDSKRRTRSEEENDKNTPDRSKQENQSVNGSNSTCSKTHRNNNKSPNEPEPLPAGSAQPRSNKEDSESDEGSCETVARNRRRQEGGAASRESGGSSEAQSLTRKRRRSKVELEDQPNELVLGKSQPLAAIMQMIGGHQHGSLFQRRLTSQESDKYRSLVLQHVDLETIQTKLRKDSYSCSTLTFYRDLLLLFTNAVVFYPKSSTESVAAHQLRLLVLNEMNKTNLITRPVSSSGPSDSLPSKTTLPAFAQARLPKLELERSDSLLAKHKSTAPIIVCRKRSSISSKPSVIALKADHPAAEAPAAFDIKPPNNNKKPSDEDDGSDAAAKTKEKPVTGTRISRRTTTSHQDNNATVSSTKRKPSSPAETPKAGKKRKTPEPATASDKKKSGAADFLKRIKRNSPAQKLKLKTGSGTSTGSKGAEQKKRGGNKTDKVKERVSRQSGGEKKKQVKEESSPQESSPSKRSVGRPSKKAAETAAPPNGVSPKRSRENGGKQQQEASKRPKKRSGRQYRKRYCQAMIEKVSW